MRLYKTQYSFRISGNRGYDRNRVRFIYDIVLFIILFYLFLSMPKKKCMWKMFPEPKPTGNVRFLIIQEFPWISFLQGTRPHFEK